MDHYNATVHNGTLVSTRRGLHVSKTKHQGTRFVNTFAAPTSSPSSPRKNRQQTDRPETQEHKFRFVGKRKDKSTKLPRGRSGTPKSRNTTPSRGSPRIEHTTLRDSQSDSAVPRTVFGFGPEEAFPVPGAHMSRAWSNEPFENDLPTLNNGLVTAYLESLPAPAYPYGNFVNTSTGSSPLFSNPVNYMDRAVAGSSPVEYEDKSWSMASGREQGSLVVEIESLTDMATAALRSGRRDQWHHHMRMLSNTVSQAGGMRPDWGRVLDKMRKVDVQGAAWTGSAPYLEFARFCKPVSEALPQGLKETLSFSNNCTLQACWVPKEVVESVRSLVLLTQTRILAKNTPPGTLQLDTRGFSEEHLWVEYQLVRFPEPLRDLAVPMDSLLLDTNAGQGDMYGYGKSLDGPPYQTSHAGYHGSSGASINTLGSAVRIAALLYAEALLQDKVVHPPHQTLLDLLCRSLRNILMRLHERDARMQDFTLTFDGLPFLSSLRPVGIWMCMVAYSIANMLETNTGELVDRTPYQDFIGLVVGSRASDVEKLPESDFELCRLLPVQELGAFSCDDAEVVKQIAAHYQGRHLLQSIDPFL